VDRDGIQPAFPVLVLWFSELPLDLLMSVPIFRVLSTDLAGPLSHPSSRARVYKSV
jgi:hypothetical protein